jgi:hypothetical protein
VTLRRALAASIVALLAAGASIGGSPRALGAETAPAIRSVDRIIYGMTFSDGFRRPAGLAADSSRGIFVVADTGKNRIVIFDAQGRCRGSMSLTDAEPGQARGEPRSVALDGRGRMYVVDGATPNVQVLTTRGTRLGELAPASRQWGPGTRAQFVAVGASGRVYVLYAGERPGVAILAPGGALVGSIGFEASDPRTFRGPVCVAVNGDESEIAVVDPEADRSVLVFSPGGDRLAVFGAHGEGEGTFSMATHVAWGPGNTLWITDTIRHSIGVFGSQGTYLGWIGGFGRGPGEFNYPAACAFLAPDRLVVLERAGARCQVLEVEVGTVPVSDPGLETSVPLQLEQASKFRR